MPSCMRAPPEAEKTMTSPVVNPEAPQPVSLSPNRDLVVAPSYGDGPLSRWCKRALYQARDWQELQPRSFDQLMTLLLQRIPCLRADNRWSHLVAVMDPLVLDDGRFACLCPNSGLGRDAQGYTIIAETFGGPDEAYGITVTT